MPGQIGPGGPAEGSDVDLEFLKSVFADLTAAARRAPSGSSDPTRQPKRNTRAKDLGRPAVASPPSAE